MIEFRLVDDGSEFASIHEFVGCSFNGLIEVREVLLFVRILAREIAQQFIVLADIRGFGFLVGDNRIPCCEFSLLHRLDFRSQHFHLCGKRIRLFLLLAVKVRLDFRK